MSIDDNGFTTKKNSIYLDSYNEMICVKKKGENWKVKNIFKNFYDSMTRQSWMKLKGNQQQQKSWIKLWKEQFKLLDQPPVKLLL